VSAVLCFGAASAHAQDGQIQCSVTENGNPSRGTVAVEQGGSKVASGACGRALSVPPGKCRVTVILDGALDAPARTVEVQVEPGKTAPVSVDFETAMLEVQVRTRGQRGTSLVAVERNGRRIGTIGVEVPAKVSAGKYVVVVRLGGQEQRHEVDLRPGQRRLVRAQF
jgi:hypothetical protein